VWQPAADEKLAFYQELGALFGSRCLKFVWDGKRQRMWNGRDSIQESSLLPICDGLSQVAPDVLALLPGRHPGEAHRAVQELVAAVLCHQPPRCKYFHLEITVSNGPVLPSGEKFRHFWEKKISEYFSDRQKKRTIPI